MSCISLTFCHSCLVFPLCVSSWTLPLDPVTSYDALWYQLICYEQMETWLPIVSPNLNINLEIKIPCQVRYKNRAVGNSQLDVLPGNSGTTRKQIKTDRGQVGTCVCVWECSCADHYSKITWPLRSVSGFRAPTGDPAWECVCTWACVCHCVHVCMSACVSVCMSSSR